MSSPSSEELFRQFLASLGVDITRPGLAETPARVVRLYREMLTPVAWNPTQFDNDGEYDSLVVLRAIPFFSLCEHHLAPFFGEATVGYLPNGHVLGLSKLARLVEHHARDLTVQERMTTRIADDLERITKARAVGVVLEARHLCAEMRGVKKAGMVTRTSTMRGELRENASLKEEFMASVPDPS